MQRTIQKSVEAEGVGVHSGKNVHLRLEPAPENSGIVFVRGDLADAPEIPVGPDSVDLSGVQRMTLLRPPGDRKSNVAVGMTEHLLAACTATGVTNLRVTVDAPECPIFDGSGLEYLRLIERAGIESQSAVARTFGLKRPVVMIKENAEMVALPAQQMRLTYFGEFAHAGLPDEQVTFEVGNDDFTTRLAPARTFCFYEDIQPLLEANLIQGGSLDSAIVLRDGKVMNGEFRMENELASHKLLDLLGDLTLLGGRINASISARRTGHALHHEFLQILREEITDD